MLDYNACIEGMREIVEESKNAEKPKVAYGEFKGIGIVVVPMEYMEMYAKEIALFLKFQTEQKGMKYIPVRPTTKGGE